MRTTQTMTVSLPPAMIREFERIRQVESRTRSELVREALRQYFESRYPLVKPTLAELAAVREGRAAYARGDSVSLGKLFNDLEPGSRRARPKGPAKTSRKRTGTR